MALPPKELLEATHRFPTQYTFKAVGPGGGAFEAAALQAVRACLGAQALASHSTRESRGGRHVSVSMHVQVAGADEILAVYARLSALEGLVLLL